MRITLFILLLSCSIAFGKTKESKGIQWRSIAEVEQLQKTEPRKIFIDVYTDWCYWCKVMDTKTFHHKDVAAYMNKYFYCIKLNAEQKDSILFKQKKYGLIPQSKTNELIYNWLHGQLTFPTSLLFDESFESPQPVPGYLDIKNMEMVVKYMAENKYKTTPWEQYQKAFKQTWK